MNVRLVSNKAFHQRLPGVSVERGRQPGRGRTGTEFTGGHTCDVIGTQHTLLGDGRAASSPLLPRRPWQPAWHRR